MTALVEARPASPSLASDLHGCQDSWRSASLLLLAHTAAGSAAPLSSRILCHLPTSTDNKHRQAPRWSAKSPWRCAALCRKNAEVRELRVARRTIRQFYKGQVITSEAQLAVIFGRRVVVGSPSVSNFLFQHAGGESVISTFAEKDMVANFATDAAIGTLEGGGR